MATTFTKSGYGQVEPNHLSAMRTGQIYAQLPCHASMTSLENGTFVKYHYASGIVEVNAASGAGEWMLVMNEVKLYEPRQFAADFRLTTAETADGQMYPRVYKTNVGDIITTNMINASGSYANGDVFTPDTTTGALVKTAAPAAGAMAWKVVKEDATMPDGSKALKLQRVV